MKTKTYLLTTLMVGFLLTSTTGIQAQTVKPKLDQAKLMQQGRGTWQGDVGKDTVEVRESYLYGKSFISDVNYNIKGKKSPVYITNFCFDTKDGNFKGFTLLPTGDYRTFIGIWITEKKLSLDVVQNFKPETVIRKIELVWESPTKMTWTEFNTNGVKTRVCNFNKVK